MTNKLIVALGCCGLLSALWAVQAAHSQAATCTEAVRSLDASHAFYQRVNKTLTQASTAYKLLARARRYVPDDDPLAAEIAALGREP